MTIQRLEQIIETKSGKPQIDNSSHPMREVTKLIAKNEDNWTPEISNQVSSLFNSRANEWNQTRHEYIKDPVNDALNRAGLTDTEVAVEVGCGTGIYTSVLQSKFRHVMSVDLSYNMLEQCDRTKGTYIQADSMRLPFKDNSISAVVLINCFLFKREILRILKGNGKLLWISTSGESTPIYLTPEQIQEIFPESTIKTSSAGWGSWCSVENLK